MTLLEVLAYVAALSVLINLGAGLFVTCLRLNTYGNAAFDRLREIADVQEGFVGVVREARAVSPAVGTYRSGQDRLVLTLPPPAGQQGVKRYAVVGPIRNGAQLTRLIVREENGRFEVEHCVTYADQFEAIRFRYDTEIPEAARLVTLEVEEKVDGTSRCRPVPHAFSAAMRNRATAVKGATSEIR